MTGFTSEIFCMIFATKRFSLTVVYGLMAW